MSLALAENRRTATKATIKRATFQAHKAMDRLDAEALTDLTRLYERARDDLQAAIRGYADRDGTLRLEVLQDLLGQVNARLAQLSSARNGLLDKSLQGAAALGVQPYAEATVQAALTQVADEAVRFVRSFVAVDGLQLTDRLWRIDRHARDVVGHAIENAVIQGHSASKAAQEFLARGEPVPKDIADKMGMSKAGEVARIAGRELMTEEGSPYHNALRLFRTEINRAHGEAYMAGGEALEDFGGWRFLLSPNHPEVDICDMHARANPYGLGPGVYPSREKCPWPAHPNTLSYIEIVFRDEITEADRAGKESRMDWLNRQPAGVQVGVLGGVKKQQALRQGVLKENEIRTPWTVLKEKYSRRSIEIIGPRENVATPVALPAWEPPKGVAGGLEPFSPFRSIDDAVAWAGRRFTDLKPGTAKLDAINSALAGIARVLDPHGISNTEIGFHKRLPAHVGALAGTSYSGHIRYIHFAPGASKSIKIANEKAAKARELHTFQRMRAIERITGQLQDPNLSDGARKALSDQLAKVQAAKRWGISNDHRVKDALQSIAAHEAGHTLYYVKRLEPAWYDALQRNKVTRLDHFAVSEYAATSVSELWAEVTAAVHSGLADDIPKNVLKAYQEVLNAINAVP